MTKWPKEWIKAVEQNRYGVGNTLQALQEVGALREVPKARELWRCDLCGYVGTYSDSHRAFSPASFCGPKAMVCYREVLDDE